MEKPELYFTTDTEWRKWLHQNYNLHPKGVYLIFYKVETNIPSMRWEEAVKVAICYGWIDSTVKSLGDGKRRQYFGPRNAKSSWSKVNKDYVKELEKEKLIHSSGKLVIDEAKKSGAWTKMDHVENLLIPEDLQIAFNTAPLAYKNFTGFAPSYRKAYLSWLHQAKRETTRNTRIAKIIAYCKANQKTRD